MKREEKGGGAGGTDSAQVDVSSLFADFSKIERSLVLPKGFITALVNEDDWSFVIKSHAIVEASLSNLLTRKTDKCLVDFYSRLPLDGRCSKVVAAKALDAIDKSAVSLIQWLSQLRNRCVHDTRYLSFDLQSYFESIAEQETRRLAILIVDVVSASRDKSLVALARQGLKEQPKFTLALAVMALLARSLFKIRPKEYELARCEARKAVSAFLLLSILVLLVQGLAGALAKSSVSHNFEQG